MKVCMNGFRQTLSNDVNELKHIVETILDNTFYQYYNNDELLESMNQIIRHSNILNCIHDKDDEDFIDMSNVNIEFIEQPPEV